MKNLIVYSFLIAYSTLSYGQEYSLPYFEEYVGNPNQYDDGIAYYVNNHIFVKSVSLQENKTKTIFYKREADKHYTPIAEIQPSHIDEYDNQYTLLPLIQATYLRIEKKNEIKSITLPEKALYHTISVTQKHIFVSGNIGKNAFFVCLDKTGNIEYEYQFDYPHAQQIKSIIEDEQGNLYLAGYIEQSINTTFDAWLAKLSPQKEILWSKLYGTAQGTDEFYKVTFTPNGLLCSGLTYRKGSFDTYILHTDREGNFGSIGNPVSYSYMNKKLLNVPKKK